MHSVEARLARWLLHIADLIEGDAIPLTQDGLSQLLGVRRTTVTQADGVTKGHGRNQIRSARHDRDRHGPTQRSKLSVSHRDAQRDGPDFSGMDGASLPYDGTRRISSQKLWDKALRILWVRRLARDADVTVRRLREG